MTEFEQPPQRNALVLPDLLALDLQSEQRGRCRVSSRAVEDKENLNPNSLRLQQKQRRLAKARAAKKTAANAVVAESTITAATVPAAPSAPSPEIESKSRPAVHMRLRKKDLVSPPLADMQGRHASYMRRAQQERTGSSLRDETASGGLMEIESPVIR